MRQSDASQKRPVNAIATMRQLDASEKRLIGANLIFRLFDASGSLAGSVSRTHDRISVNWTLLVVRGTRPGLKLDQSVTQTLRNYHADAYFWESVQMTGAISRNSPHGAHNYGRLVVPTQETEQHSARTQNIFFAGGAVPVYHVRNCTREASPRPHERADPGLLSDLMTLMVGLLTLPTRDVTRRAGGCGHPGGQWTPHCRVSSLARYRLLAGSLSVPVRPAIPTSSTTVENGVTGTANPAADRRRTLPGVYIGPP
ncbi:hypothetical protein PCANC_03255 [Puccinia coronata f. sp. avenae]|uniref:Uncharacterized protein n=1 Tax=Puccinia coronata f. sp. avenae TaxID=200324 RepID=A0A2N5VYX0_9BASI|nr:hypothetical protein PCANC_03255 [Puccinia coronata f. sp. avenae]